MIAQVAALGAGCLIATAVVAGAAGEVVTTALAGASGGGPPPTAAVMTLPVEGATVTQRFGCTPLLIEPRDPACPGGHRHTGVDLAAPTGTPVRAATAGRAAVALDQTGYGLHVVVDAGGGLSTLYAHLSAAAVTTGDAVAAGEVIGSVGSSGNSTGPHLHFEVRRDGIPEDPALDLPLFQPPIAQENRP